MFRTVIVNTGEHIKVKDNWLVVLAENEERRIPIDDIYCLVIDNQQTTITTPAVTALTNAGAYILLCNEKHLPVSIIYAHDTHYRPLNVLRRQISMTQVTKDLLWQQVVQAKLYNQGRALELCGVDTDRVSRLYELMEEVEAGDSGNREGIGAKWHFRSLFGSDFLRFNDDGINAALNYGYTIIRSAVAKTLAAYGYNCVLGIHHINEGNPFNLADDLMDPLRPVIDRWVDENHEELLNELTKQQRKELIDIVNTFVLCDKKRMQLRNAIDRYISSFTTAINNDDPRAIKFPTLIRDTLVQEDWDEQDHADPCNV